MATIAAWTSEQVLALSPDAGSTKRGRALATTTKWPTLGRSGQAAWGECKGSGKNPYRTIIDLSEPAFRCSCPSRKFPCKHALGLFLLLAEGASFSQSSPPDWVSEWLERRTQSAERKQTKAKTDSDPAAQLAAQEKRLQKRAAKVEAGLGDLAQWLEDIVRQGLAELPSKPYSFWDQTAARLVDAQAPGLARRVQNLAGIPHTGEGWPSRMLAALGQIHLLVEGYRNIEGLSPLMQAEVRSQIGWTQTQTDLLARLEQGDPLVEQVEDTWQVLGKTVTKEDALKVQRVWLWGVRSEQAVLVLSFAHGRSPLDISLVPGACFSGEIVLYPGTGIRRGFVRWRSPSVGKSRVPSKNLNRTGMGTDSIKTAIDRYSQALTQNPWMAQFPVVLREVYLHYEAEGWWVQDSEGMTLPTESKFSKGWDALAVSGGQSLCLCGEWNGDRLRPLSLWSQKTFMLLGN